MWQTVLIFLLLLGVSIYLVRHFVRAYRTEGPACGGCAGCCSHGVADHHAPSRPEIASLNLTCPDKKPHDHETCP